MNTNVKKILLIFGGGYLIYWAFTKIKPFGGKTKSKKSSSGDSMSSFSGESNDKQTKNAVMVLRAYKMAKKNGESKEFLSELNVETAKEFGLKVYTDKASGRCFVADLNGNKIL
jgi:hypothetical protein